MFLDLSLAQDKYIENFSNTQNSKSSRIVPNDASNTQNQGGNYNYNEEEGYEDNNINVYGGSHQITPHKGIEKKEIQTENPVEDNYIIDEIYNEQQNMELVETEGEGTEIEVEEQKEDGLEEDFDLNWRDTMIKLRVRDNEGIKKSTALIGRITSSTVEYDFILLGQIASILSIYSSDPDYYLLLDDSTVFEVLQRLVLKICNIEDEKLFNSNIIEGFGGLMSLYAVYIDYAIKNYGKEILVSREAVLKKMIVPYTNMQINLEKRINYNLGFLAILNKVIDNLLEIDFDELLDEEKTYFDNLATDIMYKNFNVVMNLNSSKNMVLSYDGEKVITSVIKQPNTHPLYFLNRVKFDGLFNIFKSRDPDVQSTGLYILCEKILKPNVIPPIESLILKKCYGTITLSEVDTTDNKSTIKYNKYCILQENVLYFYTSSNGAGIFRINLDECRPQYDETERKIFFNLDEIKHNHKILELTHQNPEMAIEWFNQMKIDTPCLGNMNTISENPNNIDKKPYKCDEEEDSYFLCKAINYIR